MPEDCSSLRPANPIPTFNTRHETRGRCEARRCCLPPGHDKAVRWARPVRDSCWVPRRLYKSSAKALILLFTALIIMWMLVTPLQIYSKGSYEYTRPAGMPPPHILEQYASSPPFSSNITAGDRRLVVIIPMNKPHPNLCKTISSAIALGYPSPIIVNWGMDFEREGYNAHLGKIIGTLQYLEAITSENTHESDRLEDGDLVLMVDALDTWFQLPPSVLIHRYHESNRRANRRLAQQRSSSQDVQMMDQTIVVSAQKRCWPLPEDGFNLHCDALPESPLQTDLYGPKTEAVSWFGSPPNKIRPRYINSGSMLGPIGDMKRYFRRAVWKMDQMLSKVQDLRSDQGIFGEIFGEQEVWRQWRRSHNGTEMRNDDLGLPWEETSTTAPALYEYHIGLDYEQNLFLPTVFADQDGDFIYLDDSVKIEDYSRDRGIAPPRLQGVPEDVRSTQNPLAYVLPERQQIDEELSWGSMPLYADFYTTAIPVVLHHNAHRNSLKNRREHWWTKTWYFAELRDMLAYRLRPAPLEPLASLNVDVAGQSEELVYWAPDSDRDKRKARMFDRTDSSAHGMNELEFDDVCRFPEEIEQSGKHWYDEVFRDDKGPI